MLKTGCNIDAARDIVIEKLPVESVVKVLDYKDMYVFDVYPPIFGFVAVKKNTSEAFGFNPLINDPKTFFEEWENNSITVKQ